MNIEPLREDLIAFIENHNLVSKWNKVTKFFKVDIRHPSLHTELLEPHWRGVFSFRIDKKYRAIFFITKHGTAEVFSVTNHYKK